MSGIPALPPNAGAASTRKGSGVNSEPKSMTEIILNPLNELQELARTLFLSLSPAQTRPPPPPPLTAFLKVDADLASALQLARVHQMNQRRMEALQAEVFDLDTKLREIWAELENGKRELQKVIEEGEERIEAIKRAKEGELTHSYNVPSVLT